MKKILSLLLALALLASLAACGSSTPPNSTAAAGETTAAGGKTTDTNAAIQVGYAKLDITPKGNVPLAGYGNSTQRISKGILDYLYATCIYVKDAEGTEVVIMAMDLPNMYDPLPKYRTQIANKLGLDEKQLMFTASHTHSAPDLKEAQAADQAKYNNDLLKNLEKVARDAMADAKPVTGMFHTVTETESLNFVRRYVMVDGSYAGDNYGDHSLGYAGHESDPDTTLQMLKFTREGGKDVILTNFQTHPHRTGGSKKYDISSDIVGVYRQEIETRLDCNALYFSGSSGNVNPTSRITNENVYKDHREHGKAMADYAVSAAANFAPVEMGKVQYTKTVYTGTVNHTEDDKTTYASQVVDRLNSGMSNSEAMEGYAQYGIQSVYHAKSIISKAGMPQTEDVELYSLSIGNFAMVFAPFELFSDLGVMIKEDSPFGATFVCCYANRLFSYMPTTLGFDHGGYGPNQCKFVSGTGEELVIEYVTMLNTLHGSK